ncbi:MAG: extracellular solute-binding protein [Gemmatimonadetes bacterium]|jgi:raffinose/stachyose/melibiose transport system substrate-binding protein|nr:extracellular solute-binding protein [Gemmatimonadota bacterium]MBT6146460.1 extracellular solute-binding protein [Gemmatimonadota bacterium]MBT7863192.1 extracellular solute-binding protein [Gemmatimonadota bacterium]
MTGSPWTTHIGKAVRAHWHLALILIVSAWLLWPTGGETTRTVAGVSTSDEDVRFTIKISPGGAYLPGTHPYGIGEPLQGLTDVIAAFENRFPDTRIDVLTVPAVREYLVTQLSSGHAPDILNVNVENVWTDVHKGWYVPLDTFLEQPNPFVVEAGDPEAPGYKQWWDMFRYQAISRGKAAPDGLSYCLTYDMVETGIFYNKTLFNRLGLMPPTDWEQFIDIMERIQRQPVAEGSAIVPLLVNIGAYNDWTKDLFFDQVYYDLLPGIDLYQDPIREPYLQGYLDWDELAFLRQKGFFGRGDPRYRVVWERMRELKKFTNRNLMAEDLVREFVTQRAAMIWTVCALSYRLQMDRDLGFDWGVFYVPSFTRRTTEFASGQPMCVIGGAATQLEVTNSAIADTDPSLPMSERIARSERLQRVIAFLQFLCLPEQYARIVNEYPNYLPNIVDVAPLPVLAPFEEILSRRYTTTKWVYSFDLRFSEIQRRMLELYLTGGAELDDFLTWQEKNIDVASASMMRRKQPDVERMERRWRELAPVRARMTGLPAAVTMAANQ